MSKAVLVKFRHQTNQKVKRRGNAPHFLAESKIPEAAAAEKLENYIMLWMDRWHICENNMEKRMKGHDRGIAAHGGRQKGLDIHSQSPSVPQENK